MSPYPDWLRIRSWAYLGVSSPPTSFFFLLKAENIFASL